MTEDFYQFSADETIKKLDSDLEDGLSQLEVASRKKKYGLNQLDTKTEINPLKIFIEQFRSFIIYILLFAVAISLLNNHYVDAIIILAILIINAFIGFFQELNARKSLEALKKLSRVHAKVLRNGEVVNTDSINLVPGDIIVLEAGDKVPADARLIEASRLKVQEAALTGESLSVSKEIDEIKKKSQISDQKNMVFSSTNITEGTAKAIVVRTGMQTEIGKITDLIKQAEEELTPLQIKLNNFGKKLGMIILVICALIFLISGTISYLEHGLSYQALLPLFLAAVALAVAAVPEGLPAVVTIALSIGVKRLLKKKALVRKLSSVETLGSCDVICTDKTGTLTKNEMTVRAAWTLDGESKLEGAGYNPLGPVTKKLSPILYHIGFACNNASHYKEKGMWTISGDPTEGALIVSAKKNKEEYHYKRIDEIPFDSDRKLMSVLIEENKKLKVFTKGAPDQLIHKCSHVLKNGKKIHLTKELKDEILEQNSKYAQSALRVLGFAYKEISNKSGFVEKDLIFVGLQAMIDPPRPDVVDSIKKTKEAGIRVIMITGDYKETAKAIATEIGIEGEIMTGEEMEKLTELQLITKLKQKTNIFARVIPEHKQKIVSALQKMGHIVAMTGDGVNDAPALKKANIGVAVGSGTDVAKEAADFVLLNDSFTSIVNAIEEGRGIYDNIQKVILHLLSGNVAEVMIVFIGVLIWFESPLVAIFLLWINLITDGAPALALSVDPYNKDIMKRKPVPAKQGIMTRSWWMLITYLGVITTSLGLLMYYNFGAGIEAQTVLFTFIVLTETLLLLMIRSLYNVKMFTNKWLWATIVFSLTMQALVIYSPLANVFKTAALGSTELLALGAGALVFIAAFFFFKWVDLRSKDINL